MTRFYKYIVYRLYIWRLEEKDNTPGRTAELLLCMIHYFHLVTLYAFISYFFPVFKNINLTRLQVLLIVLGILLLYHLLIYNKKKWMDYIDEFENESPEQRKKNNSLIYLYAIGSIVLFFIAIPLLFWYRH